MNGEDWQRARSNEQIELRLRQILEAAAGLFHDEDYEKVTMQKIAAGAGFTRSNLYRYFSTREEIFLALYIADARRWAKDIVTSFPGKLNKEEFLSLWMQVLSRHQRFLELSPLLAPTLEKNTSRKVYREAKIAINEIGGIIINTLKVVLPNLSEDSVAAFTRINQILIAGTWPISRRTALQDEVLEELNLPLMKLEFFEVLESSLYIFLIGLESS